MTTASVLLYWVAFASLVVASVQFFYQLVAKHHFLVPPQFIAGAGLLALTASIGLNSAAHHGTPLNGSNQLVLGAWALLIVYYVVEYLFKFKIYGQALFPVAVTLLAGAQLFGHGSSSTLAPIQETLSIEMRGWGIAFHVGLIVFANALFLIAAIAGVLYLYQHNGLRNHKTNRLMRRIPALATLENLSTKAITLGLPIYLAGQSLGVLRAISEDVNGWWVDPRIMCSGAVAFTFIGYIVMYYRQRTSGVVTAWIAVLGGVLVIILMIIARTLPIGFHLFGVIG